VKCRETLQGRGSRPTMLHGRRLMGREQSLNLFACDNYSHTNWAGIY